MLRFPSSTSLPFSHGKHAGGPSGEFGWLCPDPEIPPRGPPAVFPDSGISQARSGKIFPLGIFLGEISQFLEGSLRRGARESRYGPEFPWAVTCFANRGVTGNLSHFSFDCNTSQRSNDQKMSAKKDSMDMSEILRRLKALEEENQSLKKSMKVKKEPKFDSDSGSDSDGYETCADWSYQKTPKSKNGSNSCQIDFNAIRGEKQAKPSKRLTDQTKADNASFCNDCSTKEFGKRYLELASGNDSYNSCLNLVGCYQRAKDIKRGSQGWINLQSPGGWGGLNEWVCNVVQDAGFSKTLRQIMDAKPKR
jgi:hypothetical protein